MKWAAALRTFLSNWKAKNENVSRFADGYIAVNCRELPQHDMVNMTQRLPNPPCYPIPFAANAPAGFETMEVRFGPQGNAAGKRKISMLTLCRETAIFGNVDYSDTMSIA
jgi:hypothetical protein